MTLDPAVLSEGARSTRGLDPRTPSWLVRFYWKILALRSHHSLPVVAGEELLRFARDEIVPACGSEVPTTIRLPTLRRRLGLDSNKPVKYVVCPDMACQRLSPPLTVAGSTLCGGCNTSLVNARGGPLVKFFYSPLQRWLRHLVHRPGFFQAIDAWRTRTTRSDPADGSSPLLADIYDGTAWQAELPFLNGSGSINLLLGLGMDWFQAFDGRKSHSSGPIFISVLNLPSSQRFSPEHVHLAGITPGPREPSWHTVHAFLEPLLLELVSLQTGIDVEVPLASAPLSLIGPPLADATTSTTRTVKLRAKLLVFIGDSPARSRAGGFNPIGARDQFCPYCEVALNEKEDVALGRRTTRPRDPEQHRRDSLAVKGWSAATEATQAKETGARYSMLYELPYWRSVSSCPVDVMHALFLGVVKRVWRYLLLAYGLITRPELAWIQSMLGCTRIPSVLERPPPGLGTREGGTLSANHLAALARLLPALLATPWLDSIAHYQANRRQVKQQTASEADFQTDDDDARRHWVFLDSAAVAPAERLGNIRRFVHRGWIFEEIVVRLSVVVEYLHQKVLHLPDVDFLERQIGLLIRAIARLPFMTYNTHVLGHVAQQIRRFGPPRAFWAFAIEKHIQVLGWVPTNRRQVEFTMLKSWTDRTYVETSEHAGPHAASGTALSVRARERQRTFDETIIEEELGQRQSGGPQPLSGAAYDSLYGALMSRFPRTVFAKEGVHQSSSRFVSVANSVVGFKSVSVNGLHFTSHGHSHDLLGAPASSFAFVRHRERGAEVARLHPVQISKIFTHQHRSPTSTTTSSTPTDRVPNTTSANFALCRVFKTAALPSWFHCPGARPFVDFCPVLLDDSAHEAVFPVDALVGNAVVIPDAPPSVLFKMVL